MNEECQTFCVPNSLLCAWTWAVKMKAPVRIALYHIEAGLDHSQAEAMIDGDWHPITEIPSAEKIMIKRWGRHYPDKEPYKYMTLEEFIAANIGFTKENA